MCPLLRTRLPVPAACAAAASACTGREMWTGAGLAGAGVAFEGSGVCLPTSAGSRPSSWSCLYMHGTAGFSGRACTVWRLPAHCGQVLADHSLYLVITMRPECRLPDILASCCCSLSGISAPEGQSGDESEQLRAQPQCSATATAVAKVQSLIWLLLSCRRWYTTVILSLLL